MKRAYHLYCLLFIVSLAQASDQNDENKITESITSFLENIEAENIFPIQGSNIQFKEGNTDPLYKLGSSIKKHTNSLKLDNKFLSELTPEKYNPNKLLVVQLKCLTYIVERIDYNIDPKELNFEIVNADCALLLNPKTPYSNTQVPSPTPQKICIIAKLISTLLDPTEEAEQTIDSVLGDLECEYQQDDCVYKKARERLKTMQAIIKFLPKKSKDSNSVYLHVFSQGFTDNTGKKDSSWIFFNHHIGTIMNIFSKNRNYDKTPLHHQTAKAALGLYDEITC